MMKPDDYYERLAQEFKKSKEAIEALTKRQNDMKAELVEAVKANGFADDKGHLHYTAGSTEMKYERRVSRSLDIEAVEKWAKENDHWDDIKEIIEVVDEDKLMNLAWNDDTVAETLETFYNVKEVWAFKA
jgi:hypothetical protein